MKKKSSLSLKILGAFLLLFLSYSFGKHQMTRSSILTTVSQKTLEAQNTQDIEIDQAAERADLSHNTLYSNITSRATQTAQEGNTTRTIKREIPPFKENARTQTKLTKEDKDLIGEGNYSFYMVNNETGEVVANKGGLRTATPASITKTLATSTALELLGPDFTFKTKIGYKGTITNGILQGDLIILGSGDPTLGSIHMGDLHFIETWAQKLKTLGLTKIEGRIVVDQRIYDHEALSTHWTWEDIGNYYATGVFGFAAYDNMLRYTLSSGDDNTPVRVTSVYPSYPGLEIDIQAKSQAINYDNCYLYGDPYQLQRTLKGGIPEHKDQFIIRGDMPVPAYLVGQQLTAALQAIDIEVTKTLPFSFYQSKYYGSPLIAENSTPTDTFQTLFVQTSNTLEEICKHTNFKSDNMYCEHIFRQLGTLSHTPSSFEDSWRVLHDFWEEKGLDLSQVYLYDGCGLSPSDAYSAKFLTQLLYLESYNPHYLEFKETLPIAGRQGTVGGFLRHTPLEAKAHVKSGSFSDVQCYAGYIDYNGKSYSFTIMMNHFKGSRQTIRRLMTRWLVDAATDNTPS